MSSLLFSDLVVSAYWLISIQVHFKLISAAFQRGAVDLL